MRLLTLTQRGCYPKAGSALRGMHWRRHLLPGRTVQYRSIKAPASGARQSWCFQRCTASALRWHHRRASLEWVGSTSIFLPPSGLQHNAPLPLSKHPEMGVLRPSCCNEERRRGIKSTLGLSLLRLPTRAKLIRMPQIILNFKVRKDDIDLA